MNIISRKSALVALGLCLIFVILVGFLHIYHHIPLLSPSPYNSYTRQAMAWRSGRTFLPEDVPHLELAIFEGRYYVSFPPVPSVPIFFLSFLIEDQIPDGLLVKAYLLCAMVLIYALLLRRGYPLLLASTFSFMVCLASSMLPLVLSGAVWYQAQVLAFLLIVLAIERMDKGHPTASLLFFALSVGCRPFNVFYGPLLLLWQVKKGKENGGRFSDAIKSLLPGILMGLLIAAAYAVYNAVRFSNPLEFGHNHLPEFSFQGGKQFSISHIAKNINTFLLTPPFESANGQLVFRKFGFSMLVANPVLLLLVCWALLDLFGHKMNRQKGTVMLCFLAHLFFLLMHRTFGGYQYGSRYAVDLIPYAVLYFLTCKRKKLVIPEWLVLGFGFCLSVWGSMAIVL